MRGECGRRSGGIIFFGTVLVCLTTALAARGQYSADYQTNTYDWVTNNVAGDYAVGDGYVGDVLQIINFGVLTNGNGVVGAPGSFDNVALIASGGVWSNTDLYVGYLSPGNQLIVTNGGTVFNNGCYLGFGPPSSNNVALVTGSGSVWSNGNVMLMGYVANGNALTVADGGKLYGPGIIGYGGSSNVVTVSGTGSVWNASQSAGVGIFGGVDNQLIVTNGGTVVSVGGGVGGLADSNFAIVTGTGSVWQAYDTLLFGQDSGNSNQLTIADAGVVAVTSNVLIGAGSGFGNVVEVDGGSLIVTNAGLTGTLVVSQSGGPNSLILNSGTVQADQLLATNGANSVITFNGGTMITHGAIISNAADFIIGDTGDHATYVADGGTHLFQNDVFVGNSGANNQLIVTNGGAVFNDGGILGYLSSSSNNVAVIADGGVWSNRNDMYLGFFGANNQVLVTNGGTVFIQNSFLGYFNASSNNLVLVSGPGSVWSNQNAMVVGQYGPNNQLIVTNGGTVFAARAYVGQNAGGGNEIKVSDGTLIVTNGTGTGVLDVRRGTLSVDSGWVITDTLYVTNGAASQIEFNGGTLVAHGATINNGLSFIIGNTGSNATYVADGGTHQFPNTLYVGYNGGGNGLIVSNGAAASSSWGYLGYNASSSNNLAVVTGGGSVWNIDNSLFVGRVGEGNQLVVTDGGTVFSSSGFLGVDIPSRNNVAVITDGGVWNNSGDIYVGSSGAGNQFVVTNGGTVFNSSGYVGYNASSSNNLALITDGGVWNNTGGLNVGYSGAGNQLVVTNGGTVFSEFSILGRNASGSNNVAVIASGGVCTNSLFLNVGNSGSGNQLIITNGGTVFSGSITLGANPSSSSNVAYIASGGILNNDGTLTVGNYGAANQLIITNGGTVLAADAYVGYNPSSVGNEIKVSDGTLIVTNGTGTGVLDVRRGTLSVDSGWVITDQLYLTNGAASQLLLNGGTVRTRLYSETSGGLTKSGGGTLTLIAANSYTGATAINGGVLELDVVGAINSSSGITLNGGKLLQNSSMPLTVPIGFGPGGGTIGGIGTITTLVNVGHNVVLSPGNSPGTQTYTTDQIWSPGGTYLWQINDALGTVGSDPGWDLLNIEGTLDLTALSPGGMFTIDIEGLSLSNFDPSATYTFPILNATTISGFDSSAFAFTTAGVPGPASWSIASVGNTLWLEYASAAVPEPSILLLLLGGLGTICFARRRRK